MISKIKLLIASQTEIQGPGQITVRQSDQIKLDVIVFNRWHHFYTGGVCEKFVYRNV